MPRKREEERNQKTMHTMNEPMTVRFATEEDAPVVYRFIRKMAEYEKLEHEVDTSEEALRRSVFRERQAEVILGEVAGRPVGFALFFHNFPRFAVRGDFTWRIFS